MGLRASGVPSSRVTSGHFRNADALPSCAEVAGPLGLLHSGMLHVTRRISSKKRLGMGSCKL